MRTNQFQYGLKISEYSYLLEDDYIKQKAARIIEKKENSIYPIFHFSFLGTQKREQKYIFLICIINKFLLVNLGEGVDILYFINLFLRMRICWKNVYKNRCLI